jgi:hypothetical protein
MSVGANTEIDPSTRLANLEQAVFGGPNPGGVFPLVTGQLGIQPVLYSYSNSAFGYASFGTAITMLPSTAAAGLYQAELYAVITTTITTATSWLFKLGFTDDDQAQTPTIATSSTMTAGAINQAVYTFRSSGTAAITWTPTSASAAAGVVAVSMILTRLQ